LTDDRQERVFALFDRAVDLPAEERQRFVEDESRGDPEVRRRVLAMLAADGADHPVLDQTGDRLSQGLSAGGPVLSEGQRIGSYAITRLIGSGGMATVYLAHDARHNRQVALKLLHPGASWLVGGDRFRREIEVVAQLQHPHILPLYDSGESEGSLYFVMPFVSGETLRDRIARAGALPLDEVRRTITEVGAALDYAHRRGVVHRDIKPANILFYEEHATVSDFGIAHRVQSGSGEQLTGAGIVIGTPAYMSPEQALGVRELDPRSDLYAFGCVVYEMLSGQPLFDADSAPGIIAHHLNTPVPSIVARRPALSPAVDQVLKRALAKDPGERFASVREFVQALDTALAAPPSPTPTIPSVAASREAESGFHSRSRRYAIGIGVGTLAIAAALASQLIPGREAEVPSIAVLPFANLSGDWDNEYFSDGVTEELTGALAQLGRIRVVPRTTAFAYKGRTGDLRQIGTELGVSRILEGSVRRGSSRVLILVALHDPTSGERLWSQRYERDWGSMLELQAEIAGTIAEQLELRLLPGERARLAERHPVNADAYNSYLLGRHFFDIRTAAALKQAVIHFRRALAIDSNYARAHAGLADTYSIQAWTGSGAPHELFPLAEREAQQALRLDSTLSEAHVSLGIIYTFHHWNWAAADRATARAIALDSTQAQAWFFRTWHLVAAGKLPEARMAIERARQLEPLSLIINARVGTLLAYMGQYGPADSALRKTLEIDRQYPVARVQLARVLSFEGKHAEAIAMLPPDSVQLGSYESGIAGYVYARAGRREEALARIRSLESRGSVPAEGIAGIYSGLGDADTALAWLERAVERRGVGLIFLAVEPIYQPLRNEPRYQKLVERIGLNR
jgi:serine/threonine protein kinase/tetratricopeptide (TPR) repeat protein